MAMDMNRRRLFGVAGVAAAGAALAACSTDDKKDEATPTSTSKTAPGPVHRPEIETPAQAREELRKGNERYLNGEQVHPGTDEMRRVEVALKQEPFAAILTCADSRVPVEIVTDQGFGDLFVVRVAGNVVGSSELGSLQYAVEHLHVPLIAVAGHAKCGAVDAAVGVADGGAMPGGAVDDIVNHILPAVRAAKNEVTPDQNLLTEAIKANAIQSRDIVLKDPLIAAEVSKGKLEVVAAYYDIDTGKFVVL
ncbi:MAG TPA: carbonic anhydrase [Gordonia sp. (in: high G+C Gram-positive bacteria)]|uniref:carbonic anhydrase n=1 Tax=unclassified Gordonia (in: high G+C Gram-positive bacteria) TaxID=2657482 RepID=UPI000FBB3926|nr:MULTISPECIES: carbonic anhydrase [unclassified Gordonia (in: high G+C Gram-positive bacteria)]RUP40948.1 MAG: carbonic anhydrase [Gordonia sp. (in: high G+C Gram-positive bacteria)]HNP55332.1 carbonic anhydrase [Gordonia sp. (in: high G+C Gram-positive bacteria)]HRC50096.1 carbonic anhydrase [Gordonia sp. (in: high G+C Gram-positive bacteria)]